MNTNVKTGTVEDYPCRGPCPSVVLGNYPYAISTSRIYVMVGPGPIGPGDGNRGVKSLGTPGGEKGE